MAEDALRRTEQGSLAPLYGAAHALLAREGRWRSALAGHVAPRPHDLIVDLPCGAGDLAFQLARLEPHARILGVDPDAALVARAQARRVETRARIDFACAAPEAIAALLGPATATKIIVTLTDIHRPEDKARRLELARSVIDPLGTVFVIDYGAQRTSLMRSLHNAARALRDAPPVPGHDTLTPLLRTAGFVAVDEALSWPTPSGAITLCRARVS